MEMPKTLLPNRRLVVGMVGATILGGAGMAMAWPWRRGLPDPTDPRTTLQAVEDAVARLLPEPEMTTAALAARLAAGERIILFDTREPDGLVAYLCRSDFSFRPLGVRKPGGFCLPTLNACGAGYRSR